MSFHESVDRRREEARQRLRRAVRDEQVDPALRVKVRIAMEGVTRPRWLRWNAAAAFALVVVSGVWAFGRWHDARIDEMVRLLGNADPLLREALGDHLACVLGLRATGLGSAQRAPVRDRSLAQKVESAMPPGYRRLDVHECRYNRREMLHVVFAHERRAISLLIANRDASSIRLGDGAREGQAGPFHLVGRGLRFHVVYLVSESARDNRQLLESVTARLGSHLAELGPRVFTVADTTDPGVRAR